MKTDTTHKVEVQNKPIKKTTSATVIHIKDIGQAVCCRVEKYTDEVCDNGGYEGKAMQQP